MKKCAPLWLVIAADILLAGVILCVFALFHHVIPSMKASRAAESTASPAQAAAPTASTAAEDGRTEWQIKFAEHFTEETVWTENSYSSPNISVTVEEKSTVIRNHTTVYYVADVYVGSMDCLRTYVANGTYSYMDAESVMDMDAAVDPILAVSGDYATVQRGGFLMRNGELYSDEVPLCDICVLYADGRMVTYAEGEYTVEEILADDPLQIWNFGPALLDDAGKVKEKYDVNPAVGYPNPRSAIGYYEPGHYCFIVADGRQGDYSYGLRIAELAAIFKGLGCKAAYNLDGGGSAVMVFDHEIVSSRSNGDRELGDIIYLAEPEGTE